MVRTIYLSILLFSSTFFTFSESSHLKRVFYNKLLREQFSGFLNEVLRQVPAEDFYNYVYRLPALMAVKSDNQVYKILLDTIDKIKPTFQLYTQLKALRHQQEELARQIKLLIRKRTIDGYVEIGTPALYFSALQNKFTFEGNAYALCEMTPNAYVQNFIGTSSWKELFKKATFVSINNYALNAFDQIRESSIEMVVCTIGLHHIAFDKIVPYIQAIKRILKPGGVFILREHDVCNEDQYALTYAAHSVYNALMLQLPVADEWAEIRNFQPLSYWIKLLEAEGFAVGDQRLKQKNDPTNNTLFKCVKPITREQTQIQEITTDLKKDATYKREDIASHLSSPEWFNVDVAQEYGAFINHTPFYQFPYAASLKSYWQVFGNSWRAAAKQKGNLAVIGSSSTLMNLFVGVTMTLEYGAKMLISAPVRWLYAGEEPLTIKVLLKDKGNQVESVDESIKALKYYSDDIKLVEMPRYKEFLSCMQKIALTDIQIIEIAGQKEIQFKVRQLKEHTFPSKELHSAKKVYEWELPTQPAYRYLVLSVSIAHMLEVIKVLPNYGIELLYIHDF